MRIFETVGALQEYRNSPELKDKKIGFVPTMGALHKGHLSLTDFAAKSSDIVIVSIFVNPTQFNDPRDLKKYPRDIEKDLQLLSTKKVDAVFIPSVEEIYPEPDTRKFDFGGLDKVLEGSHRPGHFNGVAQVVSRLFDIVDPNLAFFGQKDYQQMLIIKELVRQLGMDVKIVPCPIVREDSGLAMSSRNQCLTDEDKEHAAKISQTLLKAKNLKDQYNIDQLKEWVITELNKDPFLDVEYFEITDSEKLHPVRSWDDKDEKIAFVAVKIDSVRLIDNLIFD